MRFQVVFESQSGRGGSQASDLRLHLSGVPLADHFRLKQLAEWDNESLHAISDQPFAPVHLKGAAALTALVRLFAHRILHGHGDGEQVATVRAVDICRASDGSREAGLGRVF